MNRKRVIYIGILLIVTVIVSITAFSYAFLTRIDEQHGKLNMTVGTLDYKIESDDLNNNSITLGANESKEIELIIKAENEIDTKYELYTNSVENVEIGYLNEEGFDESTGTISKNGTKKIKIVLENNSDTSKTITFGVQGGFEHNTITLASNRSSIPEGEGLCVPGMAYEFDYTGSIQEFTATCTGTYKLEVWGAQGGNSKISNGTIYAGGSGGYSVGNIDLTKNSNLYIVVGGAGENSYNVNATTHNGGFNGGGNTRSYACASGGGATHIATSLLSTGELKNYSDARDKILLVAGGGGGSAGDLNGGGYSIGGAGGGLSGINATPGTGYMDNTWGSGGVGGTQTTGFAFGQGASSDTLLISGGGSGWYGGADGTHLRLSTYPTGTSWEAAGAGGSGYIGGVINGQTIAGNQTITEPNGTTTTGHIGNGYARITYLGD